MGEVSGLVAALAVLGIMRAWDAAEKDRKYRQELLICQPETDVAVAESVTHILAAT